MSQAPIQKIKKAIIAVAGSGTRLLPATKSMPKEMLPIVDKPIIQLVVEELVEAGIEDIIFVTRWDKKPLEDHFDYSTALEDDLRKNGKEERYEQVHRIAELANFVHIRQKGPYGNGTPALSAASLVDDEPFIYCFGDDLVKSDVSFTKQMVDEYNKHGQPMLGVQEVPQSEVSKYGIVDVDPETMQVRNIIEKPSVKKKHRRDSPDSVAISSIKKYWIFSKRLRWGRVMNSGSWMLSTTTSRRAGPFMPRQWRVVSG
jgi:UTP--glucose-1-phosphate uridylyltransferase